MKFVIALLWVSVLALNIIFFFFVRSFLALYYLLWLAIVGRYFWQHRTAIEAKLVSLPLAPAVKFIGLGLLMILIEETFAGISMHLATAESVQALLQGIGQYYALNFLALPGFIIAWYALLARYRYERHEVFFLAGLFGLFAEKTAYHFAEHPITAFFLVLPTMFTYMLILAPSVISHRSSHAKTVSRIRRYALGLFVPVLCSLPFIGLIMKLKAQYPEFFPPAGFIG